MTTIVEYGQNDKEVAPATIPFIGEIDSLYEAEERRTAAIYKAADELAKVLNTSTDQRSTDYWNTTMVEALACTLDSFQRSTAIAAAVGYLQKRGYVVGKPA